MTRPRLCWYVSCPVCRRRFPSAVILRNWRADFGLIDYPAQTARSLGRGGFQPLDYIAWNRLEICPAEVREALFVFLRRIENTYWYLKELHLLSLDDYVDAYASKDDFVVAYGLLEAK